MYKVNQCYTSSVCCSILPPNVKESKSERPLKSPLHCSVKLLLGRFRVSRGRSREDKVGHGIPELQQGRQEHAEKPP